MVSDNKVKIDIKIQPDLFRKGLTDMKKRLETWTKNVSTDFQTVKRESQHMVRAVQKDIQTIAQMRLQQTLAAQKNNVQQPVSLAGQGTITSREIQTTGAAAKKASSGVTLFAGALKELAQAQNQYSGQTQGGFSSIIKEFQHQQDKDVADILRDVKIKQDEYIKALRNMPLAEQEFKKAAATYSRHLSAQNNTRSKNSFVEKRSKLEAAGSNLLRTGDALTAAQQKLTFPSRTFATASNAVGALGKSISHVVSLLGGPWVVGITAATTALDFFLNRQSTAEKSAERQGKVLASLDQQGKDNTAYAEHLEEKIRQASKEWAAYQLPEIEKNLQEVQKELANHQWKVISHAEGIIVDTPYANAIRELLAGFAKGNVEGEKFRNTLLKIGKSIPPGQRGTLEELIKLSHALEEDATVAELLRKKLSGLLNVSPAQQMKAILEGLADKPLKSIEQADAVLREMTKDTRLAREESQKNAEQQKAEALAILEKAAAAESAAAAAAKMQASIIAGLGFTAWGKQLEDTSKQHDKNAEQLKQKADNYREKLAEPNKPLPPTGPTRPSAVETIKEIRREIEQMKNGGLESFHSALIKGVEDIERKCAEAKVHLNEVQRLQDEFKQGLAEKTVLEFDQKIAQLTGNNQPIFEKELAQDVIRYTEALIALGLTTDEVAKKTAYYQDLAQRDYRTNTLESEISFLRELGELTGDNTLVTEKENELLQLRAEHLKEQMPWLAEYVDLWLKLKNEGPKPESYGDAFSKQFDSFVSEWTDATKIAEKHFGILTNAIDQLGSSVVDSIFDGAEIRADLLFRDIAKQLTKMAFNQAIAGLFGTLFGGITQSPTGGAPKPTGAPAPSGFVGPPAPGKRSLSGLPHYHNGGIAGLKSGEVPAVLMRGEGVFTQDQMARLAPIGAAQPRVNVNVVNNLGNSAEVSIQETPTANGGINLDVLIDSKVRSGIAGGRYDAALRGSFGLKRMPIGR